MFSAFNPSKCTHTWSSGQPTLQRSGSSWGFGALLKGLTSVMDNFCWSRDSNPQPRVTSLTLYPLGHDCPKLPLLKAHVQHDGAMYRQGQGIENGSWMGIASAAQKVVGSIPREHTYWKNKLNPECSVSRFG